MAVGKKVSKKVLFILTLHPPPLLMAWPLREELFFGFPKEPQKKSFLNGREIKRGGWEAVKGWAIEEKRTFSNLKKRICCYLKIEDILLKTTYQNIITANVGKVAVF